MAYTACMQYTLRKIPAHLDRALRRGPRSEQEPQRSRARRLAAGAGLAAEPVKQRDLSDLLGSWVEDPETDAVLSANVGSTPSCGVEIPSTPTAIRIWPVAIASWRLFSRRPSGCSSPLPSWPSCGRDSRPAGGGSKTSAFSSASWPSRASSPCSPQTRRPATMPSSTVSSATRGRRSPPTTSGRSPGGRTRPCPLHARRPLRVPRADRGGLSGGPDHRAGLTGGCKSTRRSAPRSRRALRGMTTISRTVPPAARRKRRRITGRGGKEELAVGEGAQLGLALGAVVGLQVAVLDRDRPRPGRVAGDRVLPGEAGQRRRAHRRSGVVGQGLADQQERRLQSQRRRVGLFGHAVGEHRHVDPVVGEADGVAQETGDAAGVLDHVVPEDLGDGEAAP